MGGQFMRRYLFLCFICLAPSFGHASSHALDEAIRGARIYCLGISDDLAHLKTMAGINTVVTSVGVATGAGATAVGVVKSGKDKGIEELEKYVEELRALGQMQMEVDYIELTAQEIQMLNTPVEIDDVAASVSDSPTVAGNESVSSELALAEEKLRQETRKSKNLGNWRTGLLAANTVTNVAGVAIAANNKVDDELQGRIDECVVRINQLDIINMQEHVAGNSDDNQFAMASNIVNVCGMWKNANLAQINAKAKAAAISSGIGSGVGLIGALTSAVANTDKTRNDNTAAGKAKEKNLNTAANVLAGGTTVASGVATIFNATQIGAIKRALEIAASCEEAL